MADVERAPGLVLGGREFHLLGIVGNLAARIEPRYPPQALQLFLARAVLAFGIARVAPIGPMIDASVPVTVPVGPHDYTAMVDALQIVRSSGVLKAPSAPLGIADVLLLRTMLKDMCRVVGRDADVEFGDDTRWA